jgi:hypothetical protein
MMALSTGCASGGFKITRGYAQWVNEKPLILRIIIYIFTTVVFGITLLLDMVIFNSMDFWDGKVSEGKYEFKDQDKVYQVHHEFQPGTRLKKSTIEIQNLDGKLIQTVVLMETPKGEIELSVDGKIRTRVRNITSLPVASFFDEAGHKLDEKTLFFSSPDFANQYLAQYNHH